MVKNVPKAGSVFKFSFGEIFKFKKINIIKYFQTI